MSTVTIDAELWEVKHNLLLHRGTWDECRLHLEKLAPDGSYEIRSATVTMHFLKQGGIVQPPT